MNNMCTLDLVKHVKTAEAPLCILFHIHIFIRSPRTTFIEKSFRIEYVCMYIKSISC